MDDAMDHESASKMPLMPPAQAAQDAGEPTGDDEGWKVESVNIRLAKNGGYIVQCSKTRDAAPSEGGQSVGPSKNYESNDYAFGSADELFDYLKGELGVEDEGAEAAPAAPAAPQGGGAAGY